MGVLRLLMVIRLLANLRRMSRSWLCGPLSESRGTVIAPPTALQLERAAGKLCGYVVRVSDGGVRQARRSSGRTRQ